MRATSLKIEYGSVHLGLGEPSPRLSWIAQGEAGRPQRAYEIAARIGPTQRTTGRVESGEAAWVDWPFAPLTSRQAFAWRVRLWDGADAPGPWSAWRSGEVGLLAESDWSADWAVIDRRPPTLDEPDGIGPAYLARAEFQLPPGATDVRLHITAHGVFEAEINGTPVTDEVLAPGWSDYRHRIVYRTFDISDLVAPGMNAIGVTIADGWYRGRLGFNGGVQNTYGSDLAVLAQVEALAEDGTPLTPLGRGAVWRAAPSHVTHAALYEGESWLWSGRAEGWSLPGFDDSSWRKAESTPVEDSPGRPVAARLAPMRVTAHLPPIAREEMPDGRVRFDFGQNLAGRVSLKITSTGPAEVRIRHAEVLEDGELATRPLRRAVAQDKVSLSDAGQLTFAPRFTVHGFRYAEATVSGAPVELEDVVAQAVHTDFERTGWFACSHDGLNQLHQNTVWSMRSNFGSLPTDCPQRDERLGWTGDIQVFAPAASYLFDCSGLLANWLDDLALAQSDLGTVPNFVPWLELGFPLGPTAAWGDAAVVVPWTLYERTGDRRLLERQFPSMKAWAEQILGLVDARGLWASDPQLGDWLDPGAPPDSPDLARTDRFLIASAYMVRSARLAAQAARVLGLTDAAASLGAAAERAAAALRREWVAPSGRVVSDTPTGLTLALAFDLLGDREQEAVAGRRLAQLVREGDHLIQTGFVGTPLICDALAKAGFPDDVYHLLEREECPSWLYPITMGATTIWERWDSMLPDGSVNPGEMTSFNHYALGSVVDFLHRKVGGLAPLAPGYRKVEIAPILGGGLEWARTSHKTPHGVAAVAWRRVGGDFQLSAELPSGVAATVALPGVSERRELAGPGHFELSGRCRPADQDPERPVHPHPAVLRGIPVAEPTPDSAAAFAPAPPHGIARPPQGGQPPPAETGGPRRAASTGGHHP